MTFFNCTKLLFFLATSAGLVVISGLLAFVVITAWSFAAWFGENATLAERALDNGIAFWLLSLNGGNALLAVVIGATEFRRYMDGYTGRHRQGIRYAVLGTGFLTLLLVAVIAAQQGYLLSALAVGFFPLLMAGAVVRIGVHLAGRVDLNRPPYWSYGLSIALPAVGLVSSAIMVAAIAASPALAKTLGLWLLLLNGVNITSMATALLATATLPRSSGMLEKSSRARRWLAGCVHYAAMAYVAIIVIFYGLTAESITSVDNMHQLVLCSMWATLAASIVFVASLNRAGLPFAQTMAGALAGVTALVGALFYGLPLYRSDSHSGDWCALATAWVLLITLLVLLGFKWRRVRER